MVQRGLLVGLVVVSGVLVWTVATWPVAHEPTSSDAAIEVFEPATTFARKPTRVATPSPPTAAHQPSGPTVVENPIAPPPVDPRQPTTSTEAEADQLFTRENGPLAEYKQRFESEPRDSAASDVEVVIRHLFDPSDGPRRVFRSVLCRETICKIETRVSAQTLGAYVAAMTRIVQRRFDSKLATERSPLAEAGEVSVTVYAKRPLDTGAAAARSDVASQLGPLAPR